MGTLLADVDEIFPGLVADRRWLHEHPELGYEEVETSRFVADRLAALGAEEIRTGLAETGVTALIRGTAEGPGKDHVVMLRADMDALPIEEENDVAYRSQTPGVMHACGHDAHVTMLLGATRLLLERRDEFAGTVKVVFQPCEEGSRKGGPGGASRLVDAGILENPHVDEIYGIHLAQFHPAGTVSAVSGPAMASGQFFKVIVQGRGGHGAAPHLAVDPIVAAAEIISSIQTIVSRNVNPRDTVVVTVGAIHGGLAANVIPDTVQFEGTIRAFSDTVREEVAQRLKAIAEAVALAHGATVNVILSGDPLPTVINTPEKAELVRTAAAKVLGAENVFDGPPWMASEDVSYYLNERPGAYFFVGSRNEEKGFIYDHHHPKFDLDEEALRVGVATTVQVVLDAFAAS